MENDDQRSGRPWALWKTVEAGWRGYAKILNSIFQILNSIFQILNSIFQILNPVFQIPNSIFQILNPVFEYQISNIKMALAGYLHMHSTVG